MHCIYCGKPLTRKSRTKDHIIPKSKSGNNDIYNVMSCCKACNSLKDNLTLEELKLKLYNMLQHINTVIDYRDKFKHRMLAHNNRQIHYDYNPNDLT